MGLGRTVPPGVRDKATRETFQSILNYLLYEINTGGSDTLVEDRAPIAADETGATDGQFFYDTSTNNLYVFRGLTFEQVTTAGINTAPVTIYQRTLGATPVPSVPSLTVRYTFEGSVLAALDNGWSLDLPPVSADGEVLWRSTVNVAARETFVDILTTDWSAPTIQAREDLEFITSLSTTNGFVFFQDPITCVWDNLTTTVTATVRQGGTIFARDKYVVTYNPDTKVWTGVLDADETDDLNIATLGFTTTPTTTSASVNVIFTRNAVIRGELDIVITAQPATPKRAPGELYLQAASEPNVPDNVVGGASSLYNFETDVITSPPVDGISGDTWLVVQPTPTVNDVNVTWLVPFVVTEDLCGGDVSITYSAVRTLFDFNGIARFNGPETLSDGTNEITPVTSVGGRTGNVTQIDGGLIDTNSLTADKINLNGLIPLTIENAGIFAGITGFPTNLADVEGSGWFVGVGASGLPQMFFGRDGNFIAWDGNNIQLAGRLITDSNILSVDSDTVSTRTFRTSQDDHIDDLSGILTGASVELGFAAALPYDDYAGNPANIDVAGEWSPHTVDNPTASTTRLQTRDWNAVQSFVLSNADSNSVARGTYLGLIQDTDRVRFVDDLGNIIVYDIDSINTGAFVNSVTVAVTYVSGTISSGTIPTTAGSNVSFAFTRNLDGSDTTSDPNADVLGTVGTDLQYIFTVNVVDDPVRAMLQGNVLLGRHYYIAIATTDNEIYNIEAGDLVFSVGSTGAGVDTDFYTGVDANQFWADSTIADNARTESDRPDKSGTTSAFFWSDRDSFENSIRRTYTFDTIGSHRFTLTMTATGGVAPGWTSLVLEAFASGIEEIRSVTTDAGGSVSVPLSTTYESIENIQITPTADVRTWSSNKNTVDSTVDINTSSPNVECDIVIRGY